jgi:hypothetical protein
MALLQACGSATVFGDSRLFEVGGFILKSLFGTATVLDLDPLHMTIEKLHKKQNVVNHSLDRQVTYFKRLDDPVKFDHQAILNLSSTIRDFAKRTQETFQEVANKFELGSKLRATATAIRELEFALARIETRID